MFCMMTKEEYSSFYIARHKYGYKIQRKYAGKCKSDRLDILLAKLYQWGQVADSLYRETEPGQVSNDK